MEFYILKLHVFLNIYECANEGAWKMSFLKPIHILNCLTTGVYKCLRNLVSELNQSEINHFDL